MFFKGTTRELRMWLLFRVFVCLCGADIELIHKSIELATFDAEDSGGGDSFALGVFECLRNDLSLDFVEGWQLVF